MDRETGQRPKGTGRPQPDSPPPELILASGSPRRKALLAEAGIPFTAFPAAIDETPLPGEEPDAYVFRVARAKAAHVGRLFPGRLILAADTAVDLDGRILGKPHGPEGVRTMLECLSGRSHRIVTAVVLHREVPRLEAVRLVSSKVTFRTLRPEEIERYVASGEGEDKAGGYGIQGQAGRFVASYEGSYSNIVGLPMEAVLELLSSVAAEER